MRSSLTRQTIVAMSIVIVLAIGGCGSPTSEEPTPPPPPAGNGNGNGAPSGDGALALDELSIGLEEFASGFDKPVLVTHAGDGSGRVFIVEQTGRVQVVRQAGGEPETFLDVSDRISTGGERGLLGLAFAPDYAESGRFYVNYTDREGDTVVDRFIADEPASDSPQLQGPEAVLEIAQPYPNHNGGFITFAPDGTLWVGMGDGGAAGDPQDNAQDEKSMLGKMLSLDVEGEDRPEPRIVQSGLRNPWRFSFDRQTRDLWIADVGQNAYEEVNLVAFDDAEGVDFGWARWEANEAYPQGANRSRDGFTFPVIDYGRDVGQSITGGYVYRGESYPSMTGTYIFGDYVSGWIGGAQRGTDGNVEWRQLLADTGVSPSSFGEDENGELYVCDHSGLVLRIVAQ